MRPIEIAPSVLSADFARLGEEVAALEAAGVDRIQWDVMDGQFVPNLTFGPDVVAACRAHTSVPFEAHLMVNTPDVLVERWVDAGCERLIIHVESVVHLHRTLGHVRDTGANAAVALNPSTPAVAIANVLDLVDMVLVMTVNPGFGGQEFIHAMLPKIRAAREMLPDHVDVAVDGGIDEETAPLVVGAGAGVLIAGTSVFKHPCGVAAGIAALRRR